jgi:dTDP-4-dehydrorhamnose 3,5-epimerase
MHFEAVGIQGAALIEPERREDDRGYFARVWCADELARHGFEPSVAQINTGVSPRAGTLRGMHYQEAPHDEVKIVRCVRGAVFDVIVDLRPASPTYRKWFGAELSAVNGRSLYAPQGTAHGYLTLADDTELVYMTNKAYAAGHARGVRYDDAAFGIRWPADVRVISSADRAWQPFAA